MACKHISQHCTDIMINEFLRFSRKKFTSGRTWNTRMFLLSWVTVSMRRQAFPCWCQSGWTTEPLGSLSSRIQMPMCCDWYPLVLFSRDLVLTTHKISGIARGLAYLHNSGVVHSDVKSVRYAAIVRRNLVTGSIFRITSSSQIPGTLVSVTSGALA